MASGQDTSQSIFEDQTAGAGPSQPQRDLYPDTSPTTRHQHIQLSPVPDFRPLRARDDGREARPEALGRTHSRVSMDFFDPKGVRKLSRTLSRVSTGKKSIPEEPSGEAEEESEVSSEAMKPQGDQFDFEKAVRTYLRKRGEARIKTRQLGVLFEHLGVVGLGASAGLQQTLSSLFNPMNIVRGIQSLRHPPLRNILTDFEGVVRPGEMLLVLGRPGSGCTTLLKTLANRRSEYHAVTGEVYYDSLTPSQIKNRHRGDVQYCPEDDILFPTLKVDKTIHFAAQTRAPQPRIENQTRKEYTRLIADVYTTIFGLTHVKETLVGDAAIRGVSGGEKKRVSISETLATRSLITSWDNSTRGLDASTALEFVRALRIATDLVHISTIVSIYQAGESLYNIFDKVCVIYEGRMAYFGPASEARQYFIDMGYQPANRQTTPDFLVGVTDPEGRIERNVEDEENVESGNGHCEINEESSITRQTRVGPIPRTAAEFAEHYKKSKIREQNLQDMEEYRRDFVGKRELKEQYRESSRAEHARHTREKVRPSFVSSSWIMNDSSHQSPYIISIPMQVRIVMARRLQILKGNYTAQLISTCVFVIQAVIIGTTFVQMTDATTGYFSRGGVLFFSVFAPTLFSMSEIPSLFAQRPIVLRHAQAAMYHPFVEALAMTLVDVPFTVLTITLFAIVIYFVAGLQTSAWQFFTYYVFLVTIGISMKAFFRALAAAFPAEAPAQAVAGILLLALSLYTGYQIPRQQMIGALRWISYINPIFYAFDALMSTEFHTINGPCSNLVPSGAGYEGISIANQVCPIVGAQPGQLDVVGAQYVLLSFGYEFGHVWRNYAILCAFGVFFVLCLLIFTEFNTRANSSTSVTQFKRGSKSAVIQEAAMAVGSDEEKKAVAKEETTVVGNKGAEEDEKKKEAALKEAPKMTNVFSWQHLNYVISTGRGKTRKLLDDVSGFVSPGKLTALMGESGSGKAGVVTGDRFFNGQPLPADFQAQTGYCQQMDTHEPTSSVREALRFSARLRQPSSVPVAEKDAYADHVLEMCGLGEFADAIVGSLGVEQRKRTTIGVELAAKPRLLLFLDEPTSGLDSQSAWAIVSFLRELADSGQAVLCTYVALLSMVFDRLLLLRKGGQTVYFGDIGKNATFVINYFETGGGRPCQPGENPAEYMLEVVGAGATAVAEQDWYEVWLKSREHQQLVEDLDRIHTEGRKQPPVERTLRGKYATPWMFQTTLLLQRQYASYWRNPTYLMSKLVLNIVGGLFIGFTFFKSGDSIQANQDKLFSIFMGTVLSAPLGGQVHVPYINMRNIYEIRERPSRMYNWSALTTSQLLCEIPWNIVGASLFFCCWYWTVGFASSRGAFTYFVYGVQFPLFWTTIALTVASASPTAEIAGLLYSFLFTFVLTFNGVLQPFRQLGWWKWMYHLSPYTYLIEALLGQAIGRMEINCSSTEFVTVDPPSGQTCGSFLQEYISRSGGYITNSDATTGCQYCSARTTDQWMGPNFNIYYTNHWRDFGIFWGYIVFNTICVYLFTYLIRVQSHNRIIAFSKRGVSSFLDVFKVSKSDV
ncbi:Brefeldin A resistance protein [Leucoagaricus sp. SymC.cos]|nr:Brefeldin A resistance protein [Leucoagaricus sp. SymC.cos]